VQPYPFTTQSLYAGHTYYKNIKWQVIDTPGILDRPLEERNTIEMQAITALAHLEACIVFFIDISEMCSYSIEEQIKLFSSIKPLFKNKPLILILNKTDIKPYKDLSDNDKNILETLAKELNTYMIQMSNITGDGVADVKSAACEILLDFRQAENTKLGKNKATKDLTGMDKVYIAQPKMIRDNRKRLPNIPVTVNLERQQREKETLFKNKNLTEEEKQKLEEKYLKEGDIDQLEKKITHNPVREKMEQMGGNGIFYVPDREHFQLKKSRMER